MEKKKVAHWYNAFTLWLTAGFAIPFIVGVITGIPAALVLGAESAVASMIVAFASTLAIWPGTMYASKFLRKKYVIDEPDQIIKIAMIIFIVLAVIGLAFSLTSGAISVFLVNLPFRIISAVLLYFAAKKYLVNNVTG